ncbi:MAG: hypothetical protein LBO62_08160 [Endomicrobium sp.]|nr:hypothetical protein [Endomicrobium sp.]
MKITASNFFPLIGVSNSNRSFGAVLIMTAIYCAIAFLFFLPSIFLTKNEDLQTIELLLLSLRWVIVCAAGLLIFLTPIFIYALFFIFEGDAFFEGLSEAWKLCFHNKKKTYFLFFTGCLTVFALNLVFIGQFITVQLILLFMFHLAFELNEADNGKPIYLKMQDGTYQTSDEASSFLSNRAKAHENPSVHSSDKLFDGTAKGASAPVSPAADADLKFFTSQKPKQPIAAQTPLPVVPGRTLKSVFNIAAENIKPEPETPLPKPPTPVMKKEFAVFKPIPYNIDPVNKNFNKPPDIESPHEEIVIEKKPEEKKETSIENKTSAIGEKEKTAVPSYVKSDKITANDDSAFVKKIIPKEDIELKSKNSKVSNVSEYSSEKNEEPAGLEKEKEEDISFLNILLEKVEDTEAKEDKPNAPKKTFDALSKAAAEMEKDAVETEIDLDINADAQKDDGETEIALDINIDVEKENVEEMKKEIENELRSLPKKSMNSKLEFAVDFRESKTSGVVRKKNPKIDTSFGFGNYENSDSSSSSSKITAKNDGSKSDKKKEYEIIKDDDK